MITTKLDPIGRDIQVLLSQDLSPKAQSEHLARFAREQFLDAQATNTKALGQTPDHETFVDGRRTEQLEAVKPDGTIVFEFALVTDALKWIHDQLVAHSPKLSGRYAASHVLLVDGVEADPDAPIDPKAKEAAFVNDQPYARKLERGHSRQAPNGIYEVVATLAARRFGNVARISFGYRSLQGGSVGAWAGKTSLQRKGRRMKDSQRRDWLTRQPAIIINL